VPVALHESIELAMVPGFHLREQHMLDALFKLGPLVGCSFFPLRIVRRLL
jgi:hypothetical protein